MFCKNQNIFQIYDDKNIKFFNKNLIDIIMKTSWSIRKSKEYDLVLEMAISSLKSSFLFIVFSNFHLIISNE